MNNIFRFRRSTFIVSVIIASILILTKCIGKQEENKVLVKQPDISEFAGSDKCLSCHKNIHEQFVQTAHHKTTVAALKDNFKGSIQKGHNSYAYNPNQTIAIEERNNEFYQVIYVNGKERKALRIDAIIGSGTRGQSFLNWQGNFLYQLPLTYYSFARQWGSSPGFLPNKIQLNRPITSRCLECHATTAYKLSGPDQVHEAFDHDRLIMGVECEKCHGPAARHVAYQEQNPNDRQGKFIINPAHFTRQQSLDMCALCHAGSMKKLNPSFTFRPGDQLMDYFKVDTISSEAAGYGIVDVHGNKYGLLRASKCFRMSQLTCTTCHNTHEKEQGKLALFSQRCMNCHNTEHGSFCKLNTSVVSLKDNCIDCHMPSKPSQSIVLFTQGENRLVAAKFRTHFITVYREESKKYLEMKSKK